MVGPSGLVIPICQMGPFPSHSCKSTAVLPSGCHSSDEPPSSGLQVHPDAIYKQKNDPKGRLFLFMVGPEGLEPPTSPL